MINFPALGHVYSAMWKTTNVSSLEEIRLYQKLLVAITQSDIKGVKRILRKGTLDISEDIRFENEPEKMTALHFAAKKGMIDIVHEILQCKSRDVNKPTPFDQATALHLVCKQCSPGAVTIARDLLSYGADPNMTDYAGRTPLFIAASLGNDALVTLLMDSGAVLDMVCENDECPEAIRRTHKTMDLNEAGVAEMYDPYKGNTPLIQACREHHASVVHSLIERRCDIHATNACGNTALHIAAKSETQSTYSDCLTRAPVAGHSDIVTILINNGIKVNARNKYGETALKRAADGVSEVFCWNIDMEDKLAEAGMFCDVVRTLVLSGADPALSYRDDNRSNSSDNDGGNGDGESAVAALENTTTVLNALLFAAHTIDTVDCLALQKKYQACLQCVLLGGAKVSSHNVCKAEMHRSTQTVMELLRHLEPEPWTLKRLAKQAIRRSVRTPVNKHVPRLCLPQYLKEYLSLNVPE